MSRLLRSTREGCVSPSTTVRVSARTRYITHLVVVEDRVAALVAGHVLYTIRIAVRRLAVEREADAGVVRLADCIAR